jgi:large subunit ribosomal protein L13e
MVRHNNVIPNQHFHKKWERRVRTWFDQPAQKKVRANKRKAKAQAASPRPAAGSLKPVVHCPTKKYSGKIKYGRGFTLQELKEAGITAAFARTIGISVDHRRTNKSQESLDTNVERLKEYQSRLVLFPRKGAKGKKGDSSKEERDDAKQLLGEIIPLPNLKKLAVSYAPLPKDAQTCKKYPHLGEESDELGIKPHLTAHAMLRKAWSDARMVGTRDKLKKAQKEAEPTKKGGDDE